MLDSVVTMAISNAHHTFACKLVWTGAERGSTSDYEAYSREYEVAFDGKPVLRGTASPVFRGDAALHNPEDLLVAALSGCHMLSYLALCARARIAVVAYEDDAFGVMGHAEGSLKFTDVLLKPRVTLAASTTPADVTRAQSLHTKAHAGCFIANSVNFPVRHEATTRMHGEASP